MAKRGPKFRLVTFDRHILSPASALSLLYLTLSIYSHMSQHSEHKTKKRKHAAAAVADEQPSLKRTKTEKAKKDKSKSKEERKGKAAPDSQFRVIEASLPLSIPPVFATNLRAGAEEMLDSMLMRCAGPCVLRGVCGNNEIACFLLG